MRIAVVGAGILGASTAYHLAAAGAEVVLVDDVAQGRATAAGAGIICPWPSLMEDPAWYMLASAGAQIAPNLTGRSESRCATCQIAAYSRGPRPSFPVTTPG